MFSPLYPLYRPQCLFFSISFNTLILFLSSVAAAFLLLPCRTRFGLLALPRSLISETLIWSFLTKRRSLGLSPRREFPGICFKYIWCTDDFLSWPGVEPVSYSGQREAFGVLLYCLASNCKNQTIPYSIAGTWVSEDYNDWEEESDVVNFTKAYSIIYRCRFDTKRRGVLNVA